MIFIPLETNPHGSGDFYPVETTKIAVVFLWPLFIIGACALLQESRFILIAGIITLFSICLFMFTALVFSFAVLSATISHREKTILT